MGERRMMTAWVLAALAGAPSAAAAGSAPIVVELRSEVTVASSHYRLGHIARVEAAQAGDRRRLGAVVIGHAPRPGQWTQATRAEIEARVAREVPDLAARVTVRGATHVRIGMRGVSVPEGRYVGVARARLERWLGKRYPRFAIREVGRARDLVVAPGALALSARLRSGSRLSRRMVVWVDALVDGALDQSAPVWFAVSVRRSVLVARGALETTAALTASDVHEEIRDVAAVAGTPLAPSESVLGQRPRRPIRAGEVLTREALEAIPAVLHGQRVTVTARVGRVSLEAAAVALRDGDPFERIPVRTPDGRAVYQVTVIGAGRVTADAPATRSAR